MLQSPNRNDIVLRLRMGKDRPVVCRVLMGVMESLERALYESDRDDIQAFAEILDLPDFIRDACLERLGQFNNQRMLITDARSGSIEIVAIVAGISIYVLDKTLGEALKGIGEAVKDGIKRSRLHETLSDYTQQKIHSVVDRVRQVLNSRNVKARVTIVRPESYHSLTSNESSSCNEVLVEISGDMEPSEIGSLSEQQELADRFIGRKRTR